MRLNSCKMVSKPILVLLFFLNPQFSKGTSIFEEMLPDEIKLKIFSYLEPIHLLKLSQTSKNLNKIAEENKCWEGAIKTKNEKKWADFEKKANAPEKSTAYKRIFFSDCSDLLWALVSLRNNISIKFVVKYIDSVPHNHYIPKYWESDIIYLPKGRIHRFEKEYLPDYLKSENITIKNIEEIKFIDTSIQNNDLWVTYDRNALPSLPPKFVIFIDSFNPYESIEDPNFEPPTRLPFNIVFKYNLIKPIEEMQIEEIFD